MAQHHDNKSKTQQPEPPELRTSVPSHHNMPSELLNNSSNLSPAELYIIKQAQREYDFNTPKSEVSLAANSTSSVRHAENMKEWREQQVNNIYKHEPYRYKYGPPPSSTTFRRTSSSSSTDRTRKK